MAMKSSWRPIVPETTREQKIISLKYELDQVSARMSEIIAALVKLEAEDAHWKRDVTIVGSKS